MVNNESEVADGNWDTANKEMAEMEQKIANLKKEFEDYNQDCKDDDEDDDEDDDKDDIHKKRKKMKTMPTSKSAKVTYISDPNLPKGWSFHRNKDGAMFYRDADNKFLKNRRNVLTEMYSAGSYTDQEIQYIRDGLREENWSYHTELPAGWMFKDYSHKIEGVSTQVLYFLSANGVIYRSRKLIMKNAEKLNLSDADLVKIKKFKLSEKGQGIPRYLENPDDSWIFDAACVPEGWKMKRYTYKSGQTKTTETVIHYLTPDNHVIRGRKQVRGWMQSNGCYTREAFGLFHFNKEGSSEKARFGRPGLVNWSEWKAATDLPKGWMERHGKYKYQQKVEYMSPVDDFIFHSKSKVRRFIKTGVKDPPASSKRMLPIKGDGRVVNTVWDGWRQDIPCLPGWKFSIGRKRNQRKIKYKSPTGKVFMSRGQLLRYLLKNDLREDKQKLIKLKRLLKINQEKHFEDLITNDKFILDYPSDTNYLFFLKICYDNHTEVPESTDKTLSESKNQRLLLHTGFGIFSFWQ